MFVSSPAFRRGQLHSHERPERGDKVSVRQATFRGEDFRQSLDVLLEPLNSLRMQFDHVGDGFRRRDFRLDPRQVTSRWF
jgi:alkanesulfonate monooxygenase SsuD/methylene tetrahydromethanopterin reductase-like flavin-dependent oxidoreductase (luciferase family)